MCCWVFAVGSGCPPLFSAGVYWHGSSLLAAWLCCAVLCCAVSCVLWRCVAVWCRAVVPCCPFCFVLWSVWSVWRCVAPGWRLWCVVLFFFVSCSAPPSCRPVPCSAAVWALFGAWCRCPCLLVGLAALFFFHVVCLLVWLLAARPVVWCAGAVFSGVLRPVLCPAVLCRVVMPCCLAVLRVCPRCWFLLFLPSSTFLLKNPVL